MSACTFFGHRDCESKIKPRLLAAIEDFILTKGVTVFYVGHQGNFDEMARHALQELKERYPHISYQVVLAYPPNGNSFSAFSPEETLVADGMEKAPKRFAISRRNQWMLQKSDYVIGYVTRSFGGAAAFLKKAVRNQKTVVNIAEQEKSPI